MATLSHPALFSTPAFWPTFLSPSAVRRLIGPPERTVVLLISPAAPWRLCSRSASLRTLPVNDKCYYCQRSGGRPLFTGLFLKLKHSTAPADLNSPDSCIHCLVTLCVEGFVPPHSAQTPIISASLFALSSVFFPSCLSAIFNLPCSKFSSDCRWLWGMSCHDESRPALIHTTMGILLPSMKPDPQYVQKVTLYKSSHAGAKLLRGISCLWPLMQSIFTYTVCVL